MEYHGLNFILVLLCFSTVMSFVFLLSAVLARAIKWPWLALLLIPVLGALAVSSWMDDAKAEWVQNNSCTVYTPVRQSNTGSSFCLVDGHRIYLGDLGPTQNATARVWCVRRGSAKGLVFSVPYHEFTGLVDNVEAR